MPSFKTSRVRLRARTPPFHGGDTGSNPVRGTKVSRIMRDFLFMVTVYVIESLKDHTWYTGMALDANRRLVEHNSGKNSFTRAHRPWKIIYTEQHSDWTLARPREKYLKTAAGKNWLAKKIEGGIAGSLPA